MYNCTNVELVPLTPALANEFAHMARLPGERPLKASRLDFFIHQLMAGTFHSPRWSVGVRQWDGKRFRLDGQHTSTMLAGLPPDQFPQGLQVVIMTWEFKSVEDDTPALFDMFDNPKSARTNEDFMGVFTSAYEEVYVLGNKFNVQICAGIGEYESSLVEGLSYPPRMRGAYYTTSPSYREFAVWASELRNEPGVVNEWMFSNAGIIAEMLSDWKSYPAVARTFWSYLLTESHTDRQHCTRQLAEDLKRWHAKPRYRPAEEYRLVVQKAWRRYQKELTMAAMAEELQQAGYQEEESAPTAD